MTPAVARDSSVKWHATRAAGSAGVESRPVSAADVAAARESAPWREAAAGRNRIGSRQHARDRRKRLGARVAELRHRSDQRLRVRVAGTREHVVDRA